LIYYCLEMVPFITPSAGPSFGFNKAETRVLISGSGNVAQFAALKVIELGATVLSLSDSKGALISCNGKGFTKDDISAIAELKLRQGVLSEVVREGLEWHAGEFIHGDLSLLCGLTSNMFPSRQASVVAREAS
jgi:glutamate dehydrogenase (NADP+)